MQTSPNKMCVRCGHFKAAFETGLCIKCTADHDEPMPVRSEAEMEHQAEEAECAHMVLDDWGVPKANEDGKVYSLVGRMDRARTFTTVEARALAGFVKESAPKWNEDVMGALLKSEACVVFRKAHGQDGIDQAVVNLDQKLVQLLEDDDA